MRISIVTPSLNQGRYLEECIRSVALQEYSNVEYIVMDGGSHDDSTAIIDHYRYSIRYSESRRDEGQADAIARGFARATGEILGWLNSDDRLAPHALATVAETFTKNPDTDLLLGSCALMDPEGVTRTVQSPFYRGHAALVCHGQWFAQPAAFWRRKAYEEAGGLDRSLQFAMDYDLFVRLTHRKEPLLIDRCLAAYREHPASKSATQWESVGRREVAAVRERHLSQSASPALIRAAETYGHAALMLHRSRISSGEQAGPAKQLRLACVALLCKTRMSTLAAFGRPLC